MYILRYGQSQKQTIVIDKTMSNRKNDTRYKQPKHYINNYNTQIHRESQILATSPLVAIVMFLVFKPNHKLYLVKR